MAGGDDQPGDDVRPADGELEERRTPQPIALTRTARFALGATIAIVLGVIVLVIVAITARPPARNAVHQATAPAVVVAQVSGVPAAVFDAVGNGPANASWTAPTVLSPPSTITDRGKPEVIYVGAEYCAFCAAERWPLVVALARFGQFTRLSAVASSSNAAFPAVHSFSFVGATYTSPYVVLSATEQFSNVRGPDGAFQSLGTVPARDRPALDRASQAAADGMPPGTLPLVDVAGIEALATSQFSPAVLGSAPMTSIAGQLANPTATTTEAIIAAANQLSAGICTATGQRPAAVCSSPGVRQADQALGLRQP